MKDHTVHSDNESNSVQQQELSDDPQHEQETIEHKEEDESDKACPSDILKKYLECLKSPSGKRRRRCISQELG